MSAIVVDRARKRYTIGQAELASEKILRTIGRLLRPTRTAEVPFEALKGISFEVPRGEAFAVIGRNGSGKSTLLKLMAGVTRPTSGEVSVGGRIGPLIEVGAGFHPELTGAENVFVNGTILGMTKSEIKRQFEAIVEFSELRRFIDTPVKRYSSGMYVRLGFSVAVHSSPDILLIDEVLSVGDAAFQQKSLAKVKHLSAEGTTVVFVSHNLLQVEQLCRTCLVLHRGEQRFLGPTPDAITTYRSLLLEDFGDHASGVSGERGPRVRGVRVLARDGQSGQVIRSGDAIDVEVDLDTRSRRERFTLNVALCTLEGLLCHETSCTTATSADGSDGTRYRVRYPAVNLAAGDYKVVLKLFAASSPGIPVGQEAVPLVVVDRSSDGGFVRLNPRWEVDGVGRSHD